MKKLVPLFCASESENKDDMDYLRPVAEKLIEAVKRYSEILGEEKKRANSYDFSDICHFALKLLVKYDESGNAEKTALAESFAERFQEILVDEYQDVKTCKTLCFGLFRGMKQICSLSAMSSRASIVSARQCPKFSSHGVTLSMTLSATTILQKLRLTATSEAVRVLRKMLTFSFLR